MELLLFFVPGILAYELSHLWRRHRPDALARVAGYLVCSTLLYTVVEQASPRYYHHYGSDWQSLWMVLPYALLLGLLWLLVRDGLVPMLGRISRNPVTRMARRMFDPCGCRLTVHTIDGAEIAGLVAASDERGVVVQDEDSGALVLIPAARVARITT